MHRFHTPRPRWLLCCCCVLSLSALAHEVDGGPDDDDDELDGGLSHVVVPPSIVTSVEAVYPPSGLRELREAHVHLELQIDATGRVTDARVLESAGEDFDASAMAAVKQYVFKPATEDGVPVRSFVTFTYAFRLPPGVADGGTPTRAPLTTTVMAQRPISASTSAVL